MDTDRHLFIVARDQADLSAYLQHEFAEERCVEVILDRRQGPDRRSGRDRRAERRPSETDRRAAERRILTVVNAQLRSLGYAMLQVG